MKVLKKALLLSLPLCIMTAVPVQAKWAFENGQYHYYDRNGQLVTDDFAQSGAYVYYLDENGNIARNCQKLIGKYLYTFDEDGRFTREKADENGNPLYVKDDYALSTRQQAISRQFNPYHDNQQVQWINATYAALTRSNGNNILIFGGGLLPSQMKELFGETPDSTVSDRIKRDLVSSWGVADRTSADEAFSELVSSAEVTGSAWDYSRAMSNLGFYYLAGYYSLDEALDKSLELAIKIQNSFASWDDYNHSYLEGYRAWSGTDGADRQAVIDGLKGSAFNPYALDWKLELKKTW